MHGIKYADLTHTPNTHDEQTAAAAQVLAHALRNAWTVQDTRDVLASLELEHVAAELGWTP